MPVVAVPWTEATEADVLAAGDVGISWVPDDLWSRGKCGLKVLQYQAAGLPVLANPVGVHPEMIAPGVSGFLAATADDWVEAVRALADDPPLRHRMGARGAGVGRVELLGRGLVRGVRRGRCGGRSERATCGLRHHRVRGNALSRDPCIAHTRPMRLAGTTEHHRANG